MWCFSLSHSVSPLRAWDASEMIWIDMMGCLILEWCGMMGIGLSYFRYILDEHRASHFVATCPPNFLPPETFLPTTLRKSLITQRLTRVNHVELNIRLQCNTKEIPTREHDQAREYSTLTIHIHYQSPNTNPVPLTPPNPKKKVHYQSSKTYSKQTSNCQQPPSKKQQIKPAMLYDLYACQVSVPASRSNLPLPSAARQSSLKDRNGCTSQCPGTLATSIILWSLPPIKACHAVERAFDIVHMVWFQKLAHHFEHSSVKITFPANMGFVHKRSVPQKENIWWYHVTVGTGGSPKNWSVWWCTCHR